VRLSEDLSGLTVTDGVTKLHAVVLGDIPVRGGCVRKTDAASCVEIRLVTY
jgi:hypothetical protein